MNSIVKRIIVGLGILGALGIVGTFAAPHVAVAHAQFWFWASFWVFGVALFAMMVVVCVEATVTAAGEPTVSVREHEW